MKERGHQIRAQKRLKRTSWVVETFGDQDAEKLNEIRRTKTCERLFETLKDRYPKAFFEHCRKPIKTGIDQDIWEAIAEEEIFNRQELKQFLAWYSKDFRYQRGLLEAAYRINLEGKGVEEISKRSKKRAQRNLLDERIKNVQSNNS